MTQRRLSGGRSRAGFAVIAPGGRSRRGGKEHPVDRLGRTRWMLLVWMLLGGLSASRSLAAPDPPFAGLLPVGVDDKQIAVDALIQELGIDASTVAHIADDENDLTLLKTVGVPICVPNAVPAVKKSCRFVTQTEGGAGAVRELCETILESRRQWQA